jgi:hypothetical protein
MSEYSTCFNCQGDEPTEDMTWTSEGYQCSDCKTSGTNNSE